MSYLKRLEYRRTVDNRSLGIVHVFAAQWRTTSGTIHVVKDSINAGIVYYDRYTKLGRLLSANSEAERAGIADALRAMHDYNGFNFVFRSV